MVMLDILSFYFVGHFSDSVLSNFLGSVQNVVNPFRATIVLGTPGSGKSYAVVNSFIRQQIAKWLFSEYILCLMILNAYLWGEI